VYVHTSSGGGPMILLFKKKTKGRKRWTKTKRRWTPSARPRNSPQNAVRVLRHNEPDHFQDDTVNKPKINGSQSNGSDV
jgi:hypothetical protein